jgi:predicted DNA-binding protein
MLKKDGYFERLSIPLPKVMKRDLLELLEKDGRKVCEYVRALIGEAIREAKRITHHGQHHR